MIEGKLLRWPLEGLHLGCITPRAELPPHDAREEGDADGVSAGITPRIGEDSNQPLNLHLEACLLLSLASHSLLHSLAHFTKATWQSPSALKWRVATLHEYHSSIWKNYYRIDG